MLSMNDENEFMLTTYDNPYNPFEDFERWWKEDLLLGHDCCGLLARTANVSSLSSEELEQEDIRQAMDYIVSRSPMIYKKVNRSNYEQVSMA